MKEDKLFKNYNFLILILIIFIIGSSMSVLKYQALHSSIMDLGLYINQFYNDLYSVEKNIMPPGGHLHIFFHFYAYLYHLFPDLYAINLLLILQSFFLIIPSYWIGKYLGKITAIAYLLYFPLWFNMLFDFHFEHLAIVFLVGFLLSVRLKILVLAIVFALLLAFVKEIFALQTIFCGLYILCSNWNKNNYQQKNYFLNYKNTRVFTSGLLIIFFGFIYFYVSSELIIPIHSNPESIVFNSSAYNWLGSNINDIFWYIILHPKEIIFEIFSNSQKLIYIFAMLGALAFIPLLSPKVLMIGIPIILISLLSKNPNHFGLGHHYTAGLIAPMIFAFSTGLPKARMIWEMVGISSKLFIPILLSYLIFVHIAMAPSPIGRLFWSDKIWSYNSQAYIQTDRDMIIKKAISNFIPFDPDVVISIQNTLNWGKLIERNDFLLFPEGITEKKRVSFFNDGFWPPNVEWKYIKAEFVVIDIKRPWFLVDTGCNWMYGECNDKKIASEYLQWIAKTKKIFDVVFEKDGFMILRRKSRD